MKKKSPLYKVRNLERQVEEELSERDLLKRIAAGKYTGEEEISAPPYIKWQKFSSHPKFYDEFMKRLYSKAYRPPSEDDKSPEDSHDNSGLDMKTRRAEPDEEENEESSPFDGLDDNRTHQISGIKSPKGTFLQADIDELFSDVPDESKVDSSSEDSRVQDGTEKGTDLIRLEREEADALSPFEEEGVDLAFDEPPPQDLESSKGPTPRKPVPKNNRRLIVYGAVVAVLAYLLLGGEKKSSEMGGATRDADDTRAQLGSGIGELISTSVNKETRVTSLIEEGLALKANDTPMFYRGALEAFREALRLDEENPKILAEIAETSARVLGSADDPDSAIEEIQRLVREGRKKDVHYSGFYRAEALVALAQGNLDASLNHAASALESDPGNAVNLALAGEIQYVRDELPQAAQSLAEALRLKQDLLIARYLYAKVNLELGDGATAKQEGLESLRLNPLHPPTYLLLGDVAASQNQYEEAKGLYETCGRLAKFTTGDVSGRAYFRLGQIFELEGSQDLAKESFQVAYHYLPELDGLKEKVKGLDTSSSVIAALAESRTYDASYFVEQGDQLVQQKKLNEAIRFYQAAYLLNPQSSKNLVKLGEITEKTANSYADFKRVMNLYQRAIEKNPSDAEGYIKLGLLETEQYNLDRALVLLRQAENLSPDDAAVFVALGKHFYKKRDYNESLNYFLKAAKINPTDSEILYYAGLLRLLFKKDSAKDAIRFFYQSYTVNPENYDALAEWLKLKVLGYEKNFAIKFIRNLIAAEPENAHYYWALGEIYSTNKEYRRAVVYYHKALDIDNRSSKFRMSLAEALESVGALQKATAEYRLASLLDRRNSDGFFKAGSLMFRIRDYKEAENVFNYLVNVTPNYPGAHRFLSKIYEQQNKKTQAIEAMEKEVKNNPSNYKFILELAQLYMKYEQYEKAIERLQLVSNLPSLNKAPEFVYDKIRAYLLLSRSYRNINKAESAEAAVRLAMEIDPSDPELHKELGYVYYALQRDKEGVEQFEFYLKRKPAAQDSNKIKGLIKKMRIEK